ncbi:MAG: ABC transporter substrate-binding protein [Lachnospiraceae bacterium]|nr:ABC transporter substrate-binding protein [Lachnospiraceae bacterium]
MKVHQYKTAGLLLLCLLSVVVAGCGQKDVTEYTEDGREIVTIGYLPITHALPVFQEQKLLEGQKDSTISIRLQKFSSWTDLMDALNAGQIDGASVLAELAMGAVSQGIDLEAVALGHKDGNVIVVSEKIQSVADLSGKTFAIPSNQSTHNILLQDMLATEEMTFGDLTIIQLPPSEMPSSLASGAIDGYCVAEPFGAQAIVQGFGHVLYDSTQLWDDSICCVLVFNGKYLENHRDTVDAFLEAYQQAGETLTKETAKETAKEYLGQDAQILEQSLMWISYAHLAITRKDYQVLYEKVKEYNINGNPPSYEDFVYESSIFSKDNILE